MEAFEYSALDNRGKEKKGILEGDSPRQIRQQLRERGLTPLRVVEIVRQEQASDTHGGFSLRRGVSAMDLALVTRQLATLVRSSLPLEEALRTVAAQTEKRHLKRILLAIRAKVREGHSLASGFADFPRVFPELYHRTIAAGEETGHLDVVLDRLADYTESRQQMRQKVLLALFYPALLTIISILIVIALLTYVVPQVVRVFENVAQDLPPLTQALITLSDTLREHGMLIFGLLAALIIGFNLLLRKPAFRAMVQRFQLKIPLIGRLIRGINAARFSRTLSILAASNVPILEALRISSQVLTNVPMRQGVEDATLRVREGSALHTALEKTGYFPPLTLSLMASGEASGDLEGMLERSANIQEREIESMIATVLGLFEPILILVMGGVVLIIVLAILLPIFELNQLVS